MIENGTQLPTSDGSGEVIEWIFAKRFKTPYFPFSVDISISEKKRTTQRAAPDFMNIWSSGTSELAVIVLISWAAAKLPFP